MSWIEDMLSSSPPTMIGVPACLAVDSVDPLLRAAWRIVSELQVGVGQAGQVSLQDKCTAMVVLYIQVARVYSCKRSKLRYCQRWRACHSRVLRIYISNSR